MGHHTKEKGDLAVFKAEADMASQGWMILRPMTEHAPFDIVIYRNCKFLTVQVKYTAMRNGKIEVKLSSCWGDKHGTHLVPIDCKIVNVYAIYCPDTDKCYYFRTKDFTKQCWVFLRIEEPRNNQSKNIRYASDYTFVPDP
jgi:hypothetical protein